MAVTNVCYLLHFSEPFGHARHYLGSTRGKRLEVRLAEHHGGNPKKSSVLTAHAAAAGITFSVARTWPGGRTEEARLKGHTPERPHGSRSSWRPRCPICRAERRA